MDAYIYQAALLCEDCADKTKSDLSTMQGMARNVEHEDSYTSDEWPMGPYSDGGGESDCPAHCDMCNVFLENPLTSDGFEYVLDSVVESLQPGNHKDLEVISEWVDHYDIGIHSLLEWAKQGRTKKGKT